MSEGKKYGLIIPKSKEKKAKAPVLKKSVFGDVEEEEDDPAAMAKVVKKLGTDSKLKRKTQLEIDKALEEDPDIYEYDAIYDKMQEERVANMPGLGGKKEKDKKPKYIEGLLRTAAHRKREYERRTERQVQKEREEEQGQYDDSESFVTGAYKQKMAEMEAEEEQERRQEAMEEVLDVRKQKDLSGFYRHLLKQTTGTVKAETPAGTTSEEKDAKDPEPNPDADTSMDSDSDSSSSSRSRSREPIPNKSKRHYRSRSSDSADRSPEVQPRSKTQRTEKPSDKYRGARRSRSRSRDRSRRSRSRSRSRRSRSKDRRSRSRDRHRRSRSRDRKRRSRSTDRHRRSKERRSRSRDRSRRSRSRERSRGGKQDETKKSTQAEHKPKPEAPPKQDKQTDSKPTDKAAEDLPTFAKRNVGDSVSDARARYLARKQGRSVAVAPPKEEDI